MECLNTSPLGAKLRTGRFIAWHGDGSLIQVELISLNWSIPSSPPYPEHKSRWCADA